MNNLELKTPYFLIDKNKLDTLVDSLFKSFYKYFKKGMIGYSFKTNNLPWIIKYMKSKGMLAEVVSTDEYVLAKKLGFKEENIIFNGPVKGKNEFKEAVLNKAIVNIDSKRELEWLKELKIQEDFNVGLRVNADIEKICPTETQCGNQDGRFGFSIEKGEFEEALNLLKKENIKLKGLHLHCSSKTRSLNIYKAICNVAVDIIKKYDLNLEYIDVGGGFFGGLENKVSFDEYFSTISEIFSNEDRTKNVSIIIEPGMSVIGMPIDYVTSVIDVKETIHNNFVLLDGSRIHIDPFMKKTSYDFEIKYNSSNSNIVDKQNLCGFTCIENDRFFSMNNYNMLNVGDNVIFHKVGAYTISLSPLFIQFYPSVYVKDNDKIIIARKRWNVDRII